MYLNTTSVQNRKHKYTQEIVIKTGCWSFRSLPSFMVCGVITCCIISTLQELYYFLFVWRFKKVDSFSELYVSFISINGIFLILKSNGIQKNTSLLDWLTNVLSQKQSFGKLLTFQRSSGGGLIWVSSGTLVCFPLGSGSFIVVWFSRLTRFFFYFCGVLLVCLIFDWWEWFSIALMTYPLLLTPVSCLLICVFCSIFQNRELSVWMRLQERRGNFI